MGLFNQQSDLEYVRIRVHRIDHTAPQAYVNS